MQEINLTFRRNDFEEIYFKKETISLTSGKLTKRPFASLVFGAIGFVSILIYSIYFGLGFMIFVMSFILIILALKYIKIYRILQEWKKEIVDYLDKESNYSSHKLILTETHFWLRQDNTEIVQKWEDYQFVNITDERIWLESAENILIPSKSVTASEYSLLKSLIRNHVPEKD